MCDTKTFEIYKLLIAERENDGKRLWLLFGLMNIINGALLTIVATKVIHVPVIKPGIYVIGFLMSLIWLGIQRRMVAWIKWWESRLEIIEEKALEGGYNIDVFRNRKLSDEDGVSTKVAAELVPVIFCFLWLFLLFWHFSTQ